MYNDLPMRGQEQAAPEAGQLRRIPAAVFGRAWVWWIAVLAWMVVIFVLSSQPRFAFVPLAWQSELVSMAAHAAEYLVLAALLWMAVVRMPELRDRAAPVALGIASLYAVSDEVHQFFVPGRVMDPRDLFVDAFGAALGVWLMQRSRSRSGQANQRTSQDQ